MTAIGGKWTTSRALAEEVVDKALAKLGEPPRPCLTAETPTVGGHLGSYQAYLDAAVARHPDIAPDLLEHLVRLYGSRHADVLALARIQPALAQPLAEDQPDIAAQVVYAVRHEFALHLDDVLLRRTGLGTLGPPAAATVDACVGLMAAELDWDADTRTRERGRIARYYHAEPDPAAAGCAS
jgi:glycerol-3-phosphate dehydrogenase